MSNQNRWCPGNFGADGFYLFGFMRGPRFEGPQFFTYTLPFMNCRYMLEAFASAEVKALCFMPKEEKAFYPLTELVYRQKAELMANNDEILHGIHFRLIPLKAVAP